MRNTFSIRKRIVAWYEQNKEARSCFIVMGGIWVLGVIAFVSLFLLDIRANQMDHYIIARNPVLGDEKQITYSVVLGEQKVDEKLVISPQYYDETTLKEQVNALFEYIDENYLGENENNENVTRDLNLVNRVEGFPFSLSWESSDPTYVSDDGTVMNDDGAIVLVNLTLTVTYGDSEFIRNYPVQVKKREKTSYEKLVETISGELKKREKTGRTSEVLLIPKQMDGVDIIISKEQGSKAFIVLFVCLVIGTLPVVKFYETKRKQKFERDKELLLSYPKLINKFMLYIGAGLTIRNAIKMVLNEEPDGSELAKELKTTIVEMENGITEIEAYDRLGRRIALAEYRKFTTLLIQNQTKGAAGFMNILEQEELSAQEKRKEHAKRLGEEAGTKILLPMVMLLVIVVVMIMIPAFLNFGSIAG